MLSLYTEFSIGANLLRKSSTAGHDYSPSIAWCCHWSHMKTFLPFLVYPLKWKGITDFVRLLCIWCAWPSNQTYYIRGQTCSRKILEDEQKKKNYIYQRRTIVTGSTLGKGKRKRTKQLTGISDDRCLSRVFEQILVLLSGNWWDAKTWVCVSSLLSMFTFQAHSSGYIINYKIRYRIVTDILQL